MTTQVDSRYASVHGALQAISGALSPCLVPGATMNRLLAFAARHPWLGQSQYLECRLGRGAPSQIDLLVSAATSFERLTLERTLDACAGATPALWPLRRFVKGWSSNASVLHGGVPVTWLEFDRMEREENPIANVGVCLAPTYLDPFSVLPGQEPSRTLDTVVESLRVTLGQEPTPQTRDAFKLSLQRLPAAARWIHLSIMAARTPVELKLYGKFPREELLPYLDAVQWAGDRRAVEALLQRYCPTERTADVLYVDLPVTGMHDPREAGLGVVFSQQHLKVSQERDPGRRALLRVLQEDGLCSPVEASALAAWPGREGHATDPRDRGRAQVERWLDVKVVHLPSRPLAAKAYLGFAARPGAKVTERDAIPPESASPAPRPALRTT
jgi:hypothetical protein